MPIHDLGYRNWDVPGRSRHRWLVVAETGVRLAMRSRWLRRMLLIAWVPAVVWGTFFFAYEQYVENSTNPRTLEIMSSILSELDVQVDVGKRNQVWTGLLSIFFRNSQAVLMVLLVGLVAPTLIAQDIRSRAFLVYFSRPITPAEYIAGKAAVIWTFLVLISTFPALLLYVIGVLLSPDMNVIADTWDLPLRVLIASVFLVVPTTMYALMLSSLTTESRFAGFAWFATWIIGWSSYSIIQQVEGFTLKSSETQWTLISPYHTLTKVQRWAFGENLAFADVLPSLMAILIVTIFATITIYRRVTAPIRI